MAIEILKIRSVHPTVGYSHVAKAGNTLFISGQIAKDLNGNLVGKGDIKAQARQIYTNLKNIVEECGGSLGHIVKMTTIITHYDFLEPFLAVLNEFFTQPYPPATLLVVESLASPDLLMEVEVTVVLV